MATDIEMDDVDGAAEVLLKRWAKPEEKKPSPKAAPPVEERTPDEEDDDHEVEEEANEEDAPEEEVASTLADDDHEVEVGDKRLKVSELKALAAKEAEISSKFDAASQAAQKAAAEQQKHSTALTSLLERAKAKWEPYSKIDFMVAQKELTSEEFAALRAQAQAAYGDVQFFEQELEQSVKTARESAHQLAVQSAQECLKALSDPETGIKDWGPKLYTDIRSYATGLGVPAGDYDQLTHPAAFKIMHKAMLYDRGQKTAMKKVVSAPKNVNKTPTGGASTSPARSKVQSAMSALRKSGDPEDAAAALLARWAQ